ncbi:type IV secretory pathway VirB10-like protein [Bradyrhizobium japonicum]
MKAALILVGFSTLAVMELETAPRMTKPVNAPPVQATVGLRVSADTLTTADRLEIPHMQFEAPPQPVSVSKPMPPPQTAIVAQQPLKIIAPHQRTASGRKFAVVLPRPRPGQGRSKQTSKETSKETSKQTSKAIVNAKRANPVAEVKPCRSGVFDGLFKVLNLSTGCQS